MGKGFPTDTRMVQNFGKRCHFALGMRSASLQSRVSQADVMRSIEKITGDTVTDATVSRWFSGQYWPQEPTMMLALAMALNSDPGWLYFGDFIVAEAPILEAIAALPDPTRRSHSH